MAQEQCELTGAATDMLEHDGFLLVRDLVSPSMVSAMRAAVLDMARAEREAGSADINEWGHQKVWHMYTKGEIFEQVFQRPMAYG